MMALRPLLALLLACSAFGPLVRTSSSSSSLNTTEDARVKPAAKKQKAAADAQPAAVGKLLPPKMRIKGGQTIPLSVPHKPAGNKKVERQELKASVTRSIINKQGVSRQPTGETIVKRQTSKTSETRLATTTHSVPQQPKNAKKVKRQESKTSETRSATEATASTRSASGSPLRPIFTQNESAYLTLGDFLGKGSFGRVFKATLKGYMTEFAVKEIRIMGKAESKALKMHETDERDIADEMEMQKHLHGAGVRNIVPCDRLIVKRNSRGKNVALYVVMPLMGGGTLYAARKKGRMNSEREIAVAMRDILIALTDMHTKARTMHGDLKPGNVMLLTKEASPPGRSPPTKYYLGDLGNGQLLRNPGDRCEHFVCTENYSSPEMAAIMTKKRKGGRKPSAGLQHDVYSLGIVAYTLANPGYDRNLITYQALCSDITRSLPRNGISAELWDFITQALTFDENARPTPTQLLAHPFIAKHLDVSID